MSKIEWTDETWNPIVGCTKISEGCQNCYAEKMAFRLAHIASAPHAYGHVISDSGKWTGLTELHYPALKKPLNWVKPRKIFVCSMGDLFHESVKFEWIVEVMKVIDECKHHTFQILTKRPEIMKKFFSWYLSLIATPFPPNLWIGVTCENQEMANLRLPILCSIPAEKRFVSIEPMLGPIDIHLWFHSGYFEPPHNDIIDWVICGGEAGPGARKIDTKWVIDLKNQCEQFAVPFFFKSYGTSIKELYKYKLIDGKRCVEFPGL